MVDLHKVAKLWADQRSSITVRDSDGNPVKHVFSSGDIADAVRATEPMVYTAGTNGALLDMLEANLNKVGAPLYLDLDHLRTT